MFNNFIGGGQIFLHKIRMFMQVMNRSVIASIILASVVSLWNIYPKFAPIDMQAAISYQKAIIAVSSNDSIQYLKIMMRPKASYEIPTITAITKKGLFARNADARKILRSPIFKVHYEGVKSVLCAGLTLFALVFGFSFVLIFALWSKYGAGTRARKHIGGSVIKTAKEVMYYLRNNKRASDFTIGDMPLVKDAETRHILVTGMTGSGKTNMINSLLPQVRNKKQPALVIDQTGEMISKYYNPDRGDIIFNPLDARSHSWDFWTDVTSGNYSGNIDPKLEKFAKVLFKFGQKENSSSDPFWNNSAETIFCACVESLLRDNNKSLKALQQLLCYMPADQLSKRLVGTRADRYLIKGNQTTAASILSVMSTSSRPLLLLNEQAVKFSLKQYFTDVSCGSESWLFFSTPPNQREVVAPLLGCLLELAISQLINIGINEKRRMWFIIDELAALGRLNSLNTLMNESRKYGGCVLAATQSANQLFDNFGHYAGNTIFGQFATKFIFRNDEPSMAKLVGDIFGHMEYMTQQKNTSYGANEIRDGISYTEQERKKLLITANDLATLENLECFVGLPEPEVRIARIKLPHVKSHLESNIGFVPVDSTLTTQDLREDSRVAPVTHVIQDTLENNARATSEDNMARDTDKHLEDSALLQELEEIEELELNNSLTKGI